MLDQARLALVLRLRRQGWSVEEIAALLQVHVDSIIQAGRDAQEQPAAAPAATPRDPAAPPAVQVRLSPDARRLELWLPAEALSIPSEQLAAQVTGECARLGLSMVVGAELLAQRIRSWVYGTWLTILESEPPTPPTPDRIEVLVPVRLAGRRKGAGINVVRRGAAIARRHVGYPGRPGRDFLGRPVEPPAPRATPLPQGELTEVSADGLGLVAASDGEVVMRNVRLHVLPMTVHEGDLSVDHGPLRARSGLVITGAVDERCDVQGEGDVHIGGQVRSARVTSALGTIRIAGPIVGTARDLCWVRAGADIFCGRAVHAVLEAAGDVIVEGEMLYSKLVVGGNLHLSRPLEECLREVVLTVGGGIMAPVPPVIPDHEPPQERRHTRVPVAVGAHVALHALPLSFTACLIADLSPGGALCRFTEVPDAFVPEAIVQIKFRLSGTPGDVIAIARVARRTEYGELGLAFLHITEHDAHRLAQFCAEELRARPGLRSGLRADRGADG